MSELIRLHEFNNIFKDLGKDDVVAILTHPSPDPDCLGAALGMSALLQIHYGLSSKIYHKGEVSHPQNKCMKNVLRIHLNYASDFDYKNHKVIIVLDANLERTGLKTEQFNKASICIDHHESNHDDCFDYADVRINGSTCSIIWEYLKAHNIDLGGYPDVATAMVLGIKIDTLDFTSPDTSELDMEAFRALLPHANKESLAKVT